MFSGSWKTTVGGMIAAAGAAMTPKWPNLGAICSALGALLLGWAARDNDKSSEAVGAQPPAPPAE